MTPTPRRLGEISAFDPQTITIVRDSCRRLPEHAQVLTYEFYRHLFEMAPAVRPMFPADMRLQQERLLQALLAAVESLDDPAALEPQLRRWGAWHRRSLGVTDDMYVYVGHALIRALRTVLGSGETSVGSAWVVVYEWLAAVMIDGADQDERRRAAELAAPSVPGTGGYDAPPAPPITVPVQESYPVAAGAGGRSAGGRSAGAGGRSRTVPWSPFDRSGGRSR